MSSTSNDVRLCIAEKEYGGWKSVRIVRGIEQLAGTFSMVVSERWPGQPSNRPINPGDACTVAIDGEVVITGYVDDVNPSFAPEMRQVGIEGRDVTGDLVDCSAEPKQWPDRDLLQIAKAVCRPFGIKVRADVSVGERFISFAVNPCETVHETLRRMARHRGVLLVSDGQGGLVITRRGTARAGAQLVEGENILSGSARRSARRRYGRYRVIGQTATSETWTPTDAFHIEAAATDAGIRRYRPLDLMAEDQAHQAQTQATWEKHSRIAKSTDTAVTVQGWRGGGELWRPNTLVDLISPSLGLSREMLITSVSNVKDDQGTRTELTLARPEAYNLQVIPEQAQDDEFGGVDWSNANWGNAGSR